jgi:hypothetical protein
MAVTWILTTGEMDFDWRAHLLMRRNFSAVQEHCPPKNHSLFATRHSLPFPLASPFHRFSVLPVLLSRVPVVPFSLCPILKNHSLLAKRDA